MSSLSGQNSNGRISGTRSSRVSSTIFYQLRQLDRKITKLDKSLNCIHNRLFLSNTQYKKLEIKREALDQKRKQVRLKRKIKKAEQYNRLKNETQSNE